MLRKIQIQKPGRYDALQLITASDLKPAPDEVRIDVAAAGVNYADAIIRMGLYASAKELHGYPITPGFEIAGVVSAVGDNVRDWKIGERALGVTLFGGYSSQICLREENLFRIPEALSLVQAAAIPTAFLTAWFCIARLAHVERGDSALVHSAAGGVGSSLVQLLKVAGAHVTGVVGAPHKVAAAKALGCDAVIDKSTEALWPTARALQPAGFAHVFDANGVSTLQASFDHLKPMGKLVIYGFHSMLPKTGGWPNYFKLAWDYLRTPRFSPLTLTQANKNVLACNLSFLGTESALLRRGMLEILAGFERGELIAPSVSTYALEDAGSAHRAIESGATVGKLVLLP